MLDVIFVVKSPEEWHRKNLQKNRKHYSFLQYLGPRMVARIQDGMGAGVYFNTLVPWENRVGEENLIVSTFVFVGYQAGKLFAENA